MSPASLRTWVTGLGVLCAAGRDPAGFTGALRAGHSGITRRETGASDEAGWPDRSAVIDGFALADALAGCEGLPATLLDSARRSVARSPYNIQVATVAALQGWLSAALDESPAPPARTGVVVAGSNLNGGYAWRQRQRFERDPAYLPPTFALHYQDTDHVGTLSQLLGIRGEGFTVGGASASGNVAIIQGARLIECGALDVCLVVGALTELSPMELRSYCNLRAAAAGDAATTGFGAPFDTGHRGFVPGEGCAVLVLESEASARRRGAPPFAELSGYAQRLDANRLADPSADGEADAMEAAIERAGLSPADIDYVNAHGTGAPLGDAAELQALRAVFGSRGPWVNATKALTGHCLSAAGVVEAVATVIQLRDSFVHPTVGLTSPVDASHRFVGPTAKGVPLRHALSNSFGFGGISTSVVFGAAPA
ncbi:beta-ketoacyl synthase N-terminal-like domain-containing protein [Streptomyces sp. NPDC057565]|uniref:beta-ketoacyl synthase N-terminal-like domain-containing protein n=1 Tax=Streptomyces sp. NPDC057565 TaxID=3346169 RepID=UPI003692EF34